MVNTKSTQRRPRIIGLDLIRTVAILMVLLSHSVPAGTHPRDLSLAGQWLNALFVGIGHVGVPIFFMLSGYFLIDRDFSNAEAVKRFYKDRVLPMAICFFLWITIYQLFLWAVNQRSLSFFGWLEDIFFFSRQGGNPNGLGVYIWNFWFMPAILGLYLAVPLISRAVQYFPRRGLWLLYGLVISQTMLFPTATLFLNAMGKAGLTTSQLDLTYFGGISGTYFFAGYLLKTSRRRLSTQLLISLAICLLGAIWVTQYAFQYTQYAQYSGGQLQMPYEYFLLLPCAWVLMRLAAMWRQAGDRLGHWLTYISGLSFGVFLCHRMISLTADKLHLFNNWTISTQTVINLFMLTIIGYVIAAIIHQIPWLDRWLLLNH